MFRIRFFRVIWARFIMGDGIKATADGEVGPREALVASLITALGLAVFVVGYWGGRDIGSMLFS
jgi:hypothetical protein